MVDDAAVSVYLLNGAAALIRHLERQVLVVGKPVR